MRHISEIPFTDPAEPYRSNGRFTRFMLRYIRDERDMVFIHLMLRILFIIVPMAVYLYLPGRVNWWLAIGYLAINWAFFTPPYILMLHCTSHRPLFKRKYDWMNKIVPWFLGPFFGETPETYFGHHIGMHHPENNLREDLSSTMEYQRDSFSDFMRYFLRFFTLGMVDLTRYLTRKKRFKLRKRTLLGELSWYLFVIIMSIVNWKATLVVFIIPFVFTRFMMMAGNWGQHAFVDPETPANCYRNSITCIEVPYNRKCFNDGYHIIHHLKPSMHYSDMAREFRENVDTYARERAIVFEGIDFFMVWFFLMTRNYRMLARKFVRLDGTFATEEEVIAFLRSRVARFPEEGSQPLSDTGLAA